MTKKEYANIHSWLKRKYGRPQHCSGSNCTGKSTNFDWALRKGKKHAKNRRHYMRLCRSCHVKYDWTTERSKRLGAVSHTKEANERRSKLYKGIPKKAVVIDKIKETQRAKNRTLHAFGQRLSLAEWAEKTGIKMATIHARINYYGFALEEALTKKKYEHI